MLELILDGEGHNGRRPRQFGPWRWEVEARGDDAHYCYHFHFSLRASFVGDAVVDVAPDSSLPEGLESFRRHRPEAVWLSRGEGWTRHPVERDAPHDRIQVRVPLALGETVSVSRMRPYLFSQVLARQEELARHPDVRLESLGETSEGTRIPSLVIGSGPRPVLLLAGQHPAEFGGVQAAMGAAAFLLSRAPEALALRQRFAFTVVPVFNPDGCLLGNCGASVDGIDLYRAFEGAAAGTLPSAPEAAALWTWIAEHQPALTLNFHCFTQPSPTGDFPWEGMYTPPDEAFVDGAAWERQRILDDTLAWKTDGLSQHGAFAKHVAGALEYQLAALGTRSVFYEVQDAVGPHRQQRTGMRVLRAALRSLEG